MIKVTSADKWFSLCVRERADWVCERCSMAYRHEPGRLHCSHVYSRRWSSVRHCPENAMACCAGCHRHISENPVDHVELYLSIHGRDRYELLQELKQRIVPKRDRPEKEIAKHYREQYRFMQSEREKGVAGRIEFVGYL